MEVRNYDKNGKLIEDLSKVKLPKEMNELIVNVIERSRKDETIQCA